jgi:hypothetical protein
MVSPDVRTEPDTLDGAPPEKLTPPSKSVWSEDESPRVTRPVFRKSTWDVKLLDDPFRVTE